MMLGTTNIKFWVLIYRADEATYYSVLSFTSEK